MNSLRCLRYSSIREVLSQQKLSSLCPLYFYNQRRWLKPVDSAQTRLENRTRDNRLDKLIVQIRKLNIILEISKLMSYKKRGPFVSLQLMSRWKNLVGLNVSIGAFVGFKIGKGFREELRNWQRVPYVKPYERKEIPRSVERFEKRVVAVIHELLSLTVEKMVEVERLAHFRKDLGIEVNLREVILKHPGIFYVSTKGSSQTLFLREAYSKSCLIEPNPIYNVGRKMLDLVLLEKRHSRELHEEKRDVEICSHEDWEGQRDGDWVLPILGK